MIESLVVLARLVQYAGTAMLFGAPVASRMVALRLAPTTEVVHVLGSAAKGVLFHCNTPLLGNSDWTL